MRKIKDLIAKVSQAREQLANLTPEVPEVQVGVCQEHGKTIEGILAKEYCRSCTKPLCYICGNTHLATHTCMVDCPINREARQPSDES